MNRGEFEQEHLDHYEEYLLNQPQCPACSANWLTIEESLLGSGYDRETALLIVNNCGTCQDRFQSLLPTHSLLELELIGSMVC